MIEEQLIEKLNKFIERSDIDIDIDSVLDNLTNLIISNIENNKNISNLSCLLNESFDNFRLKIGLKLDRASFILGKLEMLLQILEYVKFTKLFTGDFSDFEKFKLSDVDYDILKTIYHLGVVDFWYIKQKLNYETLILKQEIEKLLNENLIIKNEIRINDYLIIEKYSLTTKTRNLLNYLLQK